MAGKTFTEYKDLIINAIVSNENLLKALTINNQDFLNSTLTISPRDIPYNYVFPYKKVLSVETEPKTIIIMAFANFNFDGVKYKEGKIYFYTICHESLIRTDYGNRYDYIYEQLKIIFNNNKKLGIGKAVMSETGDLPVSDSQMGNVCCLKLSDFGA